MRAGSLGRGQNGFPRHLMQLDEAIATGAGVRSISRGQHRIAVAQQAGIAFKIGAAAAAEKCVERLAGAFAPDVPKGNLDTGEGEHEWTVAAEEMDGREHIAGDAFNVAAVASNHQRRDDGVERGPCRRVRGVTERFPPADEPVSRLHPNQQDLHMIPDLSGKQRWWSAHRERQRNNSGLDGNNVHRVPLQPGRRAGQG